MTTHSLGDLASLHLAQVVDNDDPEGRGRIRVRLHSTGLELWAVALAQSAGRGYGLACLPRRDEQVVLAFARPDTPVLLGALWSGPDSLPAEAAPVQERYLLQTPAGTRVLLDDQAPRATIETPSGYHLTLDDQEGRVTLEKGGEKIEMTASGITITTTAQVKVEAGQVSVSASQVKVDAPMSQFSGAVKCDALIANSVVGTSYTPGAGNVW